MSDNRRAYRRVTKALRLAQSGEAGINVIFGATFQQPLFTNSTEASI